MILLEGAKSDVKTKVATQEIEENSEIEVAPPTSLGVGLDKLFDFLFFGELEKESDVDEHRLLKL